MLLRLDERQDKAQFLCDKRYPPDDLLFITMIVMYSAITGSIKSQ